MVFFNSKNPYTCPWFTLLYLNDIPLLGMLQKIFFPYLSRTSILVCQSIPNPLEQDPIPVEFVFLGLRSFDLYPEL